MTKSAWQNRITRYGSEAPDQLAANPRNWRTHPASQTDALAGVLREVGVVQNVIVNERTGYVVDGHARIALALRDGQASVPVTYVDLSEEEEALILATLDPIAAMAGADAAQLDALLRDVSSGDPAVQQMLSALAEQHNILGEVEGGAGGDEFDATPESGPTRCQVGDLWLIDGGKHRLIIGDSTDADVVARLMDGERADAVITDPPYGINASSMTMGSSESSKPKTQRLSHNQQWDNKRPDVVPLLSIAPQVCIWGGNYFADVLPVTGDWLCWWKKNDNLSFAEFELAWTNFDRNARHFAHHWSGEIKQHITQKPLPVIEWCIGFCVNDALVYDPFLGSGTTVIAAHRTGRRCFGVEIEPRYGDVILRRCEAEGLTVERADATS